MWGDCALPTEASLLFCLSQSHTSLLLAGQSRKVSPLISLLESPLQALTLGCKERKLQAPSSVSLFGFPEDQERPGILRFLKDTIDPGPFEFSAV